MALHLVEAAFPYMVPGAVAAVVVAVVGLEVVSCPEGLLETEVASCDQIVPWVVEEVPRPSLEGVVASASSHPLAVALVHQLVTPSSWGASYHHQDYALVA